MYRDKLFELQSVKNSIVNKKNQFVTTDIGIELPKDFHFQQK